MKRKIAWLLIGALCVLSGCGRREKEEIAAAPTVQIAYAAYQYDQGYELAEGWMYEMTVSAKAQIDQLESLVDGMALDVLDQTFEHERAYRLVFRDAAGAVTRELLVMEDGTASMGGRLYQAAGEEPLLDWLEELRLDEQEIE